MARVRSTARVTHDGEETEATETAPISEVMRQSGLVVIEGATNEGAPAAEAEQADVEEDDVDEEEEDYNTLMPAKPSRLDFGESTVSKADMPMMIKLGYFGEAEKKLIHFVVFIWALRSQGIDPNAEAFCRVHELHYQTKAREDGLHENFGCYNFAYRNDMKAPVVSYRAKWPTGWKNEWFYVKADEKKREKLKMLVVSPLSLSFGLTRPLCRMTSGSPCQQVVAEFRVVAEQISTRDLVQKYLAYKVFLTLSEWNMPKLKGTKEKE
jgi:hypothetical protein